nr:MAG TPA: hypothetical protein [Bacteriophage sp.]
MRLESLSRSETLRSRRERKRNKGFGAPSKSSRTPLSRARKVLTVNLFYSNLSLLSTKEGAYFLWTSNTSKKCPVRLDI